MIRTDADSLSRHLQGDLGLERDDIVLLFSGLWGLGKLTHGLDDITEAFRRTIPDGLLLVPTFTYSWCKGETYDPAASECPDMGGYSAQIWKQPGFVRSGNPNFSVAGWRTPQCSGVLDDLFDIDATCFGERSFFGNLERISRQRRAVIILLGGAFKDCLFRCPLIHAVQQHCRAPYRFEKSFPDPAGSGRAVTQLVRYLTLEEYLAVNGHPPPPRLALPVPENYGPYGEDLFREGKLLRKPFAFYETRMATVPDAWDLFAAKLAQDPYYCVLPPPEAAP